MYKYFIQSQNCIILDWILLTQVITILHNLCPIAKLTLKQHGHYPASLTPLEKCLLMLIVQLDPTHFLLHREMDNFQKKNFSSKISKLRKDIEDLKKMNVHSVEKRALIGTFNRKIKMFGAKMNRHQTPPSIYKVIWL